MKRFYNSRGLNSDSETYFCSQSIMQNMRKNMSSEPCMDRIIREHAIRIWMWSDIISVRNVWLELINLSAPANIHATGQVCRSTLILEFLLLRSHVTNQYSIKSVPQCKWGVELENECGRFTFVLSPLRTSRLTAVWAYFKLSFDKIKSRARNSTENTVILFSSLIFAPK